MVYPKYAAYFEHTILKISRCSNMLQICLVCAALTDMWFTECMGLMDIDVMEGMSLMKGWSVILFFHLNYLPSSDPWNMKCLQMTEQWQLWVQPCEV